MYPIDDAADACAGILRGSGIAHALIGAAALAAHGISRSTLDQDLLAMDTRTLDAGLWQPLSDAASVDIRTPDGEDPLAGAIRFRAAGDRDVDLIVGRGVWQHDVLARAVAVRIGAFDVPVVTAADLILLKLYACGTQDKWDIEQLLASDQAGALRSDVESRLAALPRRSQELSAASFR
jgi:hypothetical protein